MLHGRHDRRKIDEMAGARMLTLCDQDEFGKTIGMTREPRR
jgi:hypothetical protein